MKTLICIPARYASTRFPGKPLAKIAGREMLLRVVDHAQGAAADFDGCQIIVATEDERIVDFCKANGIDCRLTSESCKSGTDRVMEVVRSLSEKPEFILNLQGDNPLCPSWFIKSILNAYYSDNSVEVATPVTQLSWADLDKMRENKKSTPFSGTSAVFGADGTAFWFSKNILPAIRKEDKLRQASEMSPVYRHIGLYGYRADVLDKIARMPESFYEKLEGLEQLRWIENGVKVRCVKVEYGAFAPMASLSGVDNPEDVARVEAVLKECGEV